MTETIPSAPPAAPSPKRRFWPWILLLVLLIAAAATFLYFQRKREAYDAWRWAKLPMSEHLARIPAIWSVSTLATRLQKSGKIRDSATFLEAAQEVGLQGTAPGGYALPKTADPRELAAIFKAGPTHQRITFPEGFTGLQIARRLQKHGYRHARELENLIYPAIGFSPYEGTLFPDTYWLPLNADAKQLALPLQSHLEKIVRALPRPFPKVNGKELTTKQVLVLASLVEREAATSADRPLVAGVLLNRLRKPMRLQVDAAIQYARILADKGHKTQLIYQDLKIQSPFNTYQNDGLPPTPICNPGEAALKAAARPAQTDALFYVYSPKLKHHRFASSYEQHLHNVKLGRLERDALAH